ncbi:MAG: hypothetical protein ABW208_22265 [Pyrinomonadaceae bacterium]
MALATDTARGIALQDLTGIRGRARFRRSQRARMAGWSFAQLRAFISYKARLDFRRMLAGLGFYFELGYAWSLSLYPTD